jgi:hypothetical protein
LVSRLAITARGVTNLAKKTIFSKLEILKTRNSENRCGNPNLRQAAKDIKAAPACSPPLVGEAYHIRKQQS